MGRTTGPDTPNNVSLTSDDDELLTQFVAKAQNSSVKAMLSVGGWTGARSFSTNVGSSENRTAFVKTIVDLATQFNLDGVDFECVHHKFAFVPFRTAKFVLLHLAGNTLMMPELVAMLSARTTLPTSSAFSRSCALIPPERASSSLLRPPFCRGRMRPALPAPTSLASPPSWTSLPS